MKKRIDNYLGGIYYIGIYTASIEYFNNIKECKNEEYHDIIYSFFNKNTNDNIGMDNVIDKVLLKFKIDSDTARGYVENWFQNELENNKAKFETIIKNMLENKPTI